MNAIIPVTEMGVMADSIVKSGFYGFKTKEQVMAVMLVAQAENKHPATVVQEYDIIQGRPALKSQAILARFQLAGGRVQWNENTRTKCSGTFSHEAGGTITVEWTIDMAKQAGLFRAGSGWEKYPEDMLRARVISRAVRSIYPACILGQYSVEEVMDFDDKPKMKEMGMVEVVSEPKPNSIALNIPDGDGYKAYSYHNDIESWMQKYVELYTKIYTSQKMTLDKKDEYVHNLREVNISYINTWEPQDMAELTARTVKARDIMTFEEE